MAASWQSSSSPRAHITFDDCEPLGARYQAGAAYFRVWAPEAQRVEVLIEAPAVQQFALTRTGEGYHVGGPVPLSPGTLYKYRVDGRGPYPDPWSRFQPQGPHGPSMLVDPASHRWHDADWPGSTLHGQVLYELHVGTFTRTGTFDAACERLEWLRELGITMIEVLPVAEFPGRWNWGYDAVQWFAPSHHYGDYDAFKRFVDRAHQVGLAVILDVVYNHLGPDGDYLRCFSPHYYSDRHRTDWGEALNFDGEHRRGARELVLCNAQYWIEDFHLDGFRLDATQSIHDSSELHVVAELVAVARRAAGARSIVILAENEPQRGEHLLPPERGGFGLDAMWNDDFHHATRVAATGMRDGYFHDYTGSSQELLATLRRGFLYQGQHYSWQRQTRGSPLRGLPASVCVHFLQNHDQVGNSFRGNRLHHLTSPARYRALTALLLLGPQTPMLFMGQEFGSSSRFTFFADHQPELSTKVYAGRREFLSQFQAYADPAAQRAIADPAAEDTFIDSKLDWAETQTHATTVLLHRELLRLRREDPLLASQSYELLDGATLSPHALVLRWFDAQGEDRLLLLNLGCDLVLDPCPEPLLAPPWQPQGPAQWTLLWSSEDVRFGGSGATNPALPDGRWRLAGECAVLLRACFHPKLAQAIT
jgi:maltooligosyltrehalose trehalohydrolase